MIKKKGLGKGLDALFQENIAENEAGLSLKITEIEPNRAQPRKDFSEEAMLELANSIEKHGVLQPILVRPIPLGGYQIVAGERRWRAARMAGLSEIPVIIRQMDDSEYMQISLIENLQREDLTPIEEARGYQNLIEQHGFTQEDVAKSVAKSRPAVANSLRLLNLPEEVMIMLEENLISAGHARALLAISDEDEMIKLARIVADRKLNVRQLEEIIKAKNKKSSDKKRINYYLETELALNEHLGRKVKVDGSKKKGILHIEFYGEDDLKALLSEINLSE